MERYQASMNVQQIAVNDEFEEARFKNATSGVRTSEQDRKGNTPVISTSHLIDHKRNTAFSTIFHVRDYRKQPKRSDHQEVEGSRSAE